MWTHDLEAAACILFVATGQNNKNALVFTIISWSNNLCSDGFWKVPSRWTALCLIRVFWEMFHKRVTRSKITKGLWILTSQKN
jgi:hypothetical protein